MDKNEDNKNRGIRYSAIIDGAYGLVIAQNIFCFSRPIISYCYGNIGVSFFCAFIFIAALNFTNLIANWISSRSTTDSYSNKLLILDVFSLVIIAVFTQLITDSFDSQNNYAFILKEFLNIRSIFAIFYLLLYLSFLVWNILADDAIKGLNHSQKKNRIFTSDNIIILFYCVLLISVSILEFLTLTTAANVLFWIAVGFSFVIIARYYITVIFVRANNKIKLKATWLGSFKKVLKQYFVSFKSYLMYPFLRKSESATKQFFSKIYDKTKTDDLIFDGESSGYFEKIQSLISNKEYNVVYDCGCGEAALYNYLMATGIKFEKYIGIDFAVSSKKIDQTAEILTDDIVQHNYELEGRTLFVFCNVLCYMQKDDVEKFLNKVSNPNVDILIIDPIPSLFWDATFDRVRLHYRSIKKVRRLMNKFKFRNDMIVKDYLWNIGKWYLTPLSYATLYTYY